MNLKNGDEIQKNVQIKPNNPWYTLKRDKGLSIKKSDIVSKQEVFYENVPAEYKICVGSRRSSLCFFIHSVDWEWCIDWNGCSRSSNHGPGDLF
jgi:hypothetical protein